MSPTVLQVNGYRFYVFSREHAYEPAHMHVRKGGAVGKLWLDPIDWEYMEGFTRPEQRRIVELVRQSHDLLLRAYRERHQR
jgi:Domain of unknown function (DUF4160)